MSLAEDLPELMARWDAFATEDRRKAARNLANAAVFMVPDRESGRIYPIYWLLHVRSPGKSFADIKRSNQSLDRFRPELSRMGLVELSPEDAGFEAAWEILIAACAALGTSPSKRNPGPDWTGRRIFVPGMGQQLGAEAVSASGLARSGQDGAARQVTSNRYERSKRLRDACIEHHMAQDGGRLLCQVCEMDFARRYGALGVGFIHVHHVNPLGNRQEAHEVDPRHDLKPVCPNCHAMLHRTGDATALDPEELRDRLRATGYRIGI